MSVDEMCAIEEFQDVAEETGTSIEQSSEDEGEDIEENEHWEENEDENEEDGNGEEEYESSAGNSTLGKLTKDAIEFWTVNG